MLCAFSSGTPGGRDKKLLRLLVPNPIKDIICREREVEKGREALAKVSRAAAETQRKRINRWQESRNKAERGYEPVT